MPVASQIGRVLGDDDQVTYSRLDRARTTRTFVHLDSLVRLNRMHGKGVFERINTRKFIGDRWMSWCTHRVDGRTLHRKHRATPLVLRVHGTLPRHH